MGREIRKVIPNWDHPKREIIDYRTGRMVEDYQPMYDRSAGEAFSEWLKGWERWNQGEYESVCEDHPEYQLMDWYSAFCDYSGCPPDHTFHRPAWDEQEMTWFQVYETVSEGTPVSPPFESKEELIDYLVNHGDFWDQKRGDGGWGREHAEQFVQRGFSFSMMVARHGDNVDIKMPRDGQ